MYALVITNTIQSVGRLPRAARRLDTGAWISPHNGEWTQAEHEACGYYAVTDVARPLDDATTTHDRSVELVASVPTVVWTARPWTPEELTARQQDANRATIDAAITAALAELSTLVAAGEVPTVPAGTMTSAQLSNAMRTMRDAVQANRAGAQRVAATLKQTIRLVRGDFGAID